MCRVLDVDRALAGDKPVNLDLFERVGIVRKGTCEHGISLQGCESGRVLGTDRSRFDTVRGARLVPAYFFENLGGCGPSCLYFTLPLLCIDRSEIKDILQFDLSNRAVHVKQSTQMNCGSLP